MPPGNIGYDDPSPFDRPVIAASDGNSITVTSPPPTGEAGQPTITTTTLAITGDVVGVAGETISGGFDGAQLFADPTAPTLMFAGPGTEMLVAAGGSDTLVGGGSGDMMFGDSGTSTLFGAAGGGDTMVGGSGSSVLVLQPGDADFGGTGTTTIFGAASGADTLGAGPAGATLMVSDGASDTFIGNAGASTVFTGGGSATVFTGPGQVLVVEGSGAEKVIAGSGAATVFAGAGTDLFDFAQGSGGGTMVIADFAGGRDRIELFGYDAAAVRQQAAAGATSLSLSDGTTISFPGLTHLDPSWIV